MITALLGTTVQIGGLGIINGCCFLPLEQTDIGLQRFCVAVHNKNVCAYDYLMSKAKSLACFLDTSTTNEIGDGVKYNQEERAGAGLAY